MGFENSLKGIKYRTTDFIVSISSISLPFIVQSYIEQNDNLAWIDDDLKILDVLLKAFIEDYDFSVIIKILWLFKLYFA